MGQHAPAGLPTHAASQHDTHQNGRYFHHRQEDGELGFEADASLGEPVHADRKGGYADRAVVGGGRGSIHLVHLDAQYGKAEQGLHHPEQDHQRQLWQQGQQGLLGQANTALEADGQQQKQGKGIVESGGQLQFGSHQTRQQTEQEKQYNNIQHEGSQEAIHKVLAC